MSEEDRFPTWRERIGCGVGEIERGYFGGEKGQV